MIFAKLLKMEAMMIFFGGEKKHGTAFEQLYDQHGNQFCVSLPDKSV